MCGATWLWWLQLVCENGSFSHLYLNAIFLPRQARDKHENSEKDRFLSQVECVFKDDGRIKSVRKTTPAKFVSCPSRACLGKLTSFSSSKRKLSRNEKGPFFCSQVYAKRARGLMAVRPLTLCVYIRCVLILSVTLDPFL